MKPKHVEAWPVLLITILTLTFFAVPACARDVPKAPDVPKASVEVQWEKTLTGSGDASGMRIQETSDGGYFIVGSTNCQYGMGFHLIHCDILLIKTDVNGDVEWETNKSSEWWYLDSAQQTRDGGYVFGFNSTMIKTDAAGNEEWQMTFPEVADTGALVWQTSDDGYVVLGTEVFWGDDGGADTWLMKTDPTGNVEWQETLGNGFSVAVEQTSDGGFIVLCSRRSGTWLLKTDWTGKQEWDEAFGHTASLGVIQTSDGGFIILGLDGSKFWLIKIGSDSSLHSLQWDQSFDSPSWPRSIQQTPDGGCIVVGEGGWLMKIDSEGDMEWDATLGGSGNISGVAQTSDGGYIAVGSTTKNAAGQYDIWVMKVKCTPP